MTPEILTVQDAAGLLGCEPSTLEAKLMAGEFPGVRYGRGGWRIPAAALHQHLTDEAMRNIGKRVTPAAEAKLTPPPKRRPPTLVSLN